MEKIMHYKFYDRKTSHTKNNITFATVREIHCSGELSACKNKKELQVWIDKNDCNYREINVNDYVFTNIDDGAQIGIECELIGFYITEEALNIDIYVLEYMDKKEKVDNEFEYITADKARSILMELQECSTDHARYILDEIVELKIMEKEKEQERTIDQEFLYEKLEELNNIMEHMFQAKVHIESLENLLGELHDGFNFYIKEQAKQ